MRRFSTVAAAAVVVGSLLSIACSIHHKGIWEEEEEEETRSGRRARHAARKRDDIVSGKTAERPLKQQWISPRISPSFSLETRATATAIRSSFPIPIPSILFFFFIFNNNNNNNKSSQDLLISWASSSSSTRIVVYFYSTKKERHDLLVFLLPLGWNGGCKCPTTSHSLACASHHAPTSHQSVSTLIFLRLDFGSTRLDGGHCDISPSLLSR